MSDYPLTEEEEDEIWNNSVTRWKKQKEEKRIEREQQLAAGITPTHDPEAEDKEWMNLPIFMNSLPDSEKSNTHIDALQAIVDDTDPEEMADCYKDQGNERLGLTTLKTTTEADKKRYTNEAIYFYTKALEVKCPNMKKNSIYLSNRAAVQLTVGGNGRAYRDCVIAIEFDRNNMKAHYRAVKALVNMLKYKQAIEQANIALEVSPDNKDILALKDQAQKAIDREVKRQQEKQDEITRRQQQVYTLATKLKEKKMTLGSALFDMSKYTHSSDRAVTVDADGSAHFPTVFLYPEYGQSDFILDFQEGTCFGDHLDVMFPPGNQEYANWDKERKYTVDKLDIYFQTNWTAPVLATNAEKTALAAKPKRWIKVRHTTTIDTVLSHPEYIIPQIPIFYIVSRGSKFANKFLLEIGAITDTKTTSTTTTTTK